MIYKPCDVVVIEGHKWNPMDLVIYQRTSTWWGHCAVIKDEYGNLFDPRGKGIENNHISKYKDRNYVIRQYKYVLDISNRIKWCEEIQASAHSYDFLALLGFLTGIKSFQDSNHWYCAELPYWMFQSKPDTMLTEEELAFVYPCFFMQSNDFYTVGKNLVVT